MDLTVQGDGVVYKKDIFMNEVKNIGFETKEFEQSNVILKLPLSTKIYVNVNEDSFNLEPKFGVFKRKNAIYIDVMLALLILSTMIFNQEFDQYLKLLVFLMFIGLVVAEAYRYVISQRAIKKIYGIVR